MSCHFSSPKGGISLYKLLLLTQAFLPATHHTSRASKGIQAITHNECTNRDDAVKHRRKHRSYRSLIKSLKNQTNNSKPASPSSFHSKNATQEIKNCLLTIHTTHSQVVPRLSTHNASCLILHVKFFPPRGNFPILPKIALCQLLTMTRFSL